MIAIGLPRCLWNDAWSWKHTYVCTIPIVYTFLMTKFIYMSRETAEICQFFELASYNWIMYYQGTVEYPMNC